MPATDIPAVLAAPAPVAPPPELAGPDGVAAPAFAGFLALLLGPAPTEPASTIAAPGTPFPPKAPGPQHQATAPWPATLPAVAPITPPPPPSSQIAAPPSAPDNVPIAARPLATPEAEPQAPTHRAAPRAAAVNTEQPAAATVAPQPEPLPVFVPAMTQPDPLPPREGAAPPAPLTSPVVPATALQVAASPIATEALSPTGAAAPEPAPPPRGQTHIAEDKPRHPSDLSTPAPMTFVPTPDPVQPLAAAPIHPATSPVGKAPAEQLAQVLVSIARDPAGARHMTLQLQPDALGRLQIQVDQAPDAPTRVRISAERPETLALLQRDAPQLQRALDQAGVPRETIMLSFHAAPAVATSPQASDGGQTNPQFLGTGQPHQGFADGRAPRTQPEREDGGEDITAANPIAPPGRARSGLDITA